ncbi:hypothetical protein EYZ11_001118 [Aspergillus tanneri]|uniref:FG-GAP repeat protein n=1 Tax=Aspergillus tanneri TaxID=1220188 RepID=A0A4S3JVD4_9EURO|nr:uncharacterized protein ATNIH1004_004438 [Aspergillus tanneri]KAA8648553.1 hypothetical protein ATNIH1004_004438 [Aspergillus tanneri]THC99394.1 hypothetical protein EYZ11_001118 [Aspergillus tanneri]
MRSLISLSLFFLFATSLAAPYQTRILETGTTFNSPDPYGPWQMIPSSPPSLAYIKTTNTGTGRVEVHIASGSSRYQSRTLEVGTTFVSEDNGTWQLIDADGDGVPDLVYIKTRNTGTGRVEVHIASGASNYQTRILEVGTTFYPEDDGVWQMGHFNGDGKLDLIYIKTRNTGTGRVEVHVASGASNYQNRVQEVGTTFYPEDDGVWQMRDFNRDGRLDLVYIKTRNTGTGKVEVHVASGSSTYQTRVQEVGTTFYPEDNGFWELVDYNGDRVLDLVYIKTRNTGTGRIEVHVASGRS